MRYEVLGVGPRGLRTIVRMIRDRVVSVGYGVVAVRHPDTGRLVCVSAMVSPYPCDPRVVEVRMRTGLYEMPLALSIRRSLTRALGKDYAVSYKDWED